MVNVLKFLNTSADPGVVSSIPAWSITFVKIDHEIISAVILLPSAESFKKGFCQLQGKVCARSTGKPLVQACLGKSVVRWTDRPAMAIAVDMGRKATKQTIDTSCLQKDIDKQCRPRSDCFWRSSLIRVFPVCYSDKHFVTSSLEKQDFICQHKRKVFEILENLP